MTTTSFHRILPVLVAGLLLALLGTAFAATRIRHQDVSFPTPYQAVLLSNGTVYYGQLTGYGTPNPVLTHAFYIVSRADASTKQVQNVLVRRGQELHGPDRMYLNPASIAFVETVGQNSKVAQLIAEAAKQ